jgi:serine/threonine protein kinase
MGSRPAIEAKASVLGELERLLLDCKAFVHAYLQKGSMSRVAGAMLSSDKTKLADFRSRIDSLILRFGFIDRAEAAKQAGGAGKASDGMLRVFWKDMTITATLGTGATANVYSGKWKHTEVAIKTLHTNADLAEVRKELEAIKRLGNHPRIVSLMAICEDLPPGQGKIAIVMELAHKGDLQTYLESKPQGLLPLPLALPLQLRLALDIADGLLYCHERGLIHRDLKTKNVVVDANDRAKICDFGISRFLENERTAMTVGGLGTPQYAAIEVLEASLGSQIHPACDVYSLGVILWEMVTGQRPWKDHTPLQIGMALKQGKGLVIPAGSSCDQQLRQLIASCLHNDYRQRPKLEAVYAGLGEMLERKRDWDRACGGRYHIDLGGD